MRNSGNKRTITPKKLATVQKDIYNACYRGAPNACDMSLTETQLAKAELPIAMYTLHAG